VPFAAFVAHVSFLKESCLKVLDDGPATVGSAMLSLDKLALCFLGAVGEGYHRPTPGPHGSRANLAFGSSIPSAESVPTPGFRYGMVGRSQVMQRVFEQIRQLAVCTAPVLVVGETGTGKELVARAIHEAGPRRGRPFIALNCAALPRDLIESELFGYKRGAFSGAVNDCRGLFHAADGGTMLLDEVTEMSPDGQTKLLRVLQERCIRPVGSVREEAVDVRVIASTNRDPGTALRTRMLRPDLYYRLCVGTIVLPPLRERRDDAAALVEFHLASLDERHGLAGRATHGVTSEAMHRLIAQPWPGNVRELFNVIEGAYSRSDGLIDVHHLALTMPAMPEETPTAAGPVTFAEAERTLIVAALASAGGNKLRAAAELGISRKRLYARLARYGLVGNGRRSTWSMNGSQL